MQNSRGKEQTQQGADLIKQEVVLRLRLANDTMLLIKEKKDWSSLYKKKPNTIYGNFSKSKRCKIAKSVDFDNSENLEKISLNPYDAKTISMEKNNTTISSIDSNDSQQHNNSITIYKTENNIKSFMNSMRIRKMYNRTTQDRRTKSENMPNRVNDSRITVIKKHRNICNEIIENINKIEKDW